MRLIFKNLTLQKSLIKIGIIKRQMENPNKNSGNPNKNLGKPNKKSA
jgi:hypothetical protein